MTEVHDRRAAQLSQLRQGRKAFAFLFHRNDPWNYNWLRPDNNQKPVCESVKTLIATDR